jgi:hypothetical protein
VTEREDGAILRRGINKGIAFTEEKTTNRIAI